MATFAAPPRAQYSRRAILVSALAGIVALAIAGGCAGPHGPRHGPSEPPQPTLAAEAEFSSGSVLACATVTSFRRNLPGLTGRPSSEGDSDHGRSGPPHRGGGGMGPPPGAGGFGGPPPAGEGSGGQGPGTGRPSGGAGFAAMPRQTLTITFTNRSDSPVTLAVSELNSLIGNFAPQPERLTIAPGATVSLDPVSGDAGGLLNWLDVTLSLRQGGAAETRTLHLVPTGEPGGDAPPPHPPGD